MWSQRGHRVIANVPLYNWKQYAFILIVAGGRDIVQRREERIFAHHSYGSLLFELCSEALRTGKRGRPKQTLRKGVKVRLKNKGAQRHKRGRKRPKYQAPYPEHPDTAQPLATTDIHANHLEAFNTSLRRRCAAYRRRTNTYAKNQTRLQERLDVYWIVHNFVRAHFTTRQVPAVALGILESGFSLHEVFFIQKIA